MVLRQLLHEPLNFMSINLNLICQRIHNDMVGYETKWMNILHENTRWYHMKVDKIQKATNNLCQTLVCRVTILFAPQESCLELDELICFQLFSRHD